MELLSYTIKTKGIDAWKRHYKKIERRMQGKAGDPLQKAVSEGAIEVRKVAKAQYLTGPRPQRLGVVTGRLRASVISWSKRKGDTAVGIVGTNVEYASKHEYGIGVRKRPFLSPALRESRKFIRNRIDRALKEIYKK